MHSPEDPEPFDYEGRPRRKSVGETTFFDFALLLAAIVFTAVGAIELYLLHLLSVLDDLINWDWVGALFVLSLLPGCAASFGYGLVRWLPNAFKR
jgi:hypothetical protein